MIYIFIAISVVYSIIPILAFKEGIRLGMKVTTGGQVERIKNPLESILKAKPPEQKLPYTAQDLNNWLSYDGSQQGGTVNAK